MNLKRFKFLCFFFLFAYHGTAQDSTRMMPLSEFIGWVLKNHPLAKQAGLQVEKAVAELQMARGAFDPVANLDASRKTLDGKQYYYYSNPELSLLTPAAVLLKAGFENNQGDLLISEITKGKSAYLGLEIPFGNGLLIDKRRAALQQAKILQSLSQQERQTIINDLLLNAYSDYWEWAGAYQVFAIHQEYLLNATKRFALIKTTFVNGDRSAMDTLESFAQLQQFKLMASEALLHLQKASFELSNYLWDETGSPFLLAENTKPDVKNFTLPVKIDNLDILISKALVENPEIQMAALKIASSEVDRKLKFQNLLPYVSLKANILSKDYQLLKGWDLAYMENNYKWGFGFNMPLFFRQGRGEYNKAKIKWKESQLAFASKKWAVQNKIRTYYNELQQLLTQTQLAMSMKENFMTLQKNEELRFGQGESSLFLVNTRENKSLEAKQKLISLQIKLLVAKAKMERELGKVSMGF